MGAILSQSAQIAPTSDDRIQRAMQTFQLSKKDIVKFWDAFKRHDVNQCGVISMSAFYDSVIHEPRTIFGDGLFDIIECDDGETIDFGEFVAAITTYCFFEIPEVLKFVMYVFDRDKSGFVMQNEFRLLVDALHNHNMSKNVTFALDNWKYNKTDGKFYFSELVKMSQQFPGLLFPAFRMQSAMMNTIGGESWWNRRKTSLYFSRELASKRTLNKQLRAKQKAEEYRQAQIRRHMGFFSYHLNPWERKRFDAIYPITEPPPLQLLEDDEEDAALAAAGLPRLSQDSLSSDSSRRQTRDSRGDDFDPSAFDGRPIQRTDFLRP